ncbi:diphosphomevalonate decarboxylase [Acholeplasma granularum]|uniref:diphosphomevalonate decarboxylase n=1 Tax=Acholeplasma granularum TaxID=264635 RepID=UPI0004B9D7FF|nr:diphosphomevalonate decarboxylase [Acholeplasma granularum]
MKHTAKANVNIALIKYWGKKNSEWNLPLTSSISVTLDKFYTITTVTYDNNLKEDILYIDNNLIVDSEFLRVKNFMDKIRQLYNIPYYAKIESMNYVPKKAGLASSASAFSALAKAATMAYNINLSDKELSSLARLGSGSASRSIYGGIVKWHEGFDHLSSYAEQISTIDDLAILICLVDTSEKKINSRDAMNTLNKYPKLKKEWILNTKDALESMEQAIFENDFESMGYILESHAKLMHYVIQETGITYLNHKSFEIIDLTEKIRNEGIPVFATMDAGPNIKIITKKEYIQKIISRYEKHATTLVSFVGKGVESI